MMTNLFSMFDPSSSLMNLNWQMITVSMIIFHKMSKKTMKMKLMKNILLKFLKNELLSMMENSKKNNSVNMLLTIFLMIFIMNIMSLFPHNFTISSQISISFTTALTLWISFLIMGWTKNKKTMLSHLLPTGTPTMLMPIMIIIELTSQMIRPITLAIRLTANMIAGHLLLDLLSTLSITSKNMTIFCWPMMSILTFLEICVSIIQAFVFMTLLTLYSTEIK